MKVQSLQTVFDEPLEVKHVPVDPENLAALAKSCDEAQSLCYAVAVLAQGVKSQYLDNMWSPLLTEGSESLTSAEGESLMKLQTVLVASEIQLDAARSSINVAAMKLDSTVQYDYDREREVEIQPILSGEVEGLLRKASEAAEEIFDARRLISGRIDSRSGELKQHGARTLLMSAAGKTDPEMQYPNQASRPLTEIKQAGDILIASARKLVDLEEQLKGLADSIRLHVLPEPPSVKVTNSPDRLVSGAVVDSTAGQSTDRPSTPATWKMAASQGAPGAKLQ